MLVIFYASKSEMTQIPAIFRKDLIFKLEANGPRPIIIIVALSTYRHP
jgi:hypothetical protein